MSGIIGVAGSKSGVVGQITDIDMTGLLAGTSGSMDIKNEANNENVFIKTTSSSSEVQAIKIHSHGLVELSESLKIGTSGKGIDFSATADTSATGASMSSELLDDYEEGTWTPVNNTNSHNDNSGTYTKIGQRVCVEGWVSATGGSSGTTFTGLPYSSSYNNNAYGGGYTHYQNAVSGIQFGIHVYADNFVFYNANQAVNLGSGQAVHFSIIYRTTS